MEIFQGTKSSNSAMEFTFYGSLDEKTMLKLLILKTIFLLDDAKQTQTEVLLD